MAKAIIDEELLKGPGTDQQSDKVKVLYFFFKDIGEQSYVANAICALLHQLYSTRHIWQACYLNVEELVDLEGPALKSDCRALWRLLFQSLSSPYVGNVVCVLDALDECEPKDRTFLIEQLEHLALQQSGTKVKFLVTSRPYQQIMYDFKPMLQCVPSIHLDGEAESESLGVEIDQVIDQRMAEIASRMELSPFILKTLTKSLKEKQQRTYLWLALVFEAIKQLAAPTDTELLAQINALPTTVQEQYEKILRKSLRPDLARTILSLVAIARRPLRLEELELLVKIDASCEDKTDVDLCDAMRFKWAARDACGLFLNVVDGHVYLIHQTAKEFLLSHDYAASDTKMWKGSIGVSAAHADIAVRCMQALILEADDWTSGPSHFRDTYLQYALWEWASHLQCLRLEDAHTTTLAFRKLSEHVSSKAEFARWLLHAYYYGKGIYWDPSRERYVSWGLDPDRDSRVFKARKEVENSLWHWSRCGSFVENLPILLASLFCMDAVFDELLHETTFSRTTINRRVYDTMLDRETRTEDPLETAFSIAVKLGNQHQIRTFLQFFGYTT